MTKPEAPKTPKELDDIVDLVLSYKAKPKTKSGKKLKTMAAKVENEKSAKASTNSSHKEQ